MGNTTLLFDFNNLAMRCAHLPQVRINTPYPRMDFWAYLVFTAIYDFMVTVAADTQEELDVILACDSTTGYWRRDVYPPYKMDRVERRAADDIDWPRIYAYIDYFLETIKTHLPWAVLRVPKCEADDVIYVACRRLNDGRAVIHSTDVDFVQLISNTVKVYNPLHGYSEFPGEFKVGSAKHLCRNVQEFLDISVLTGQGGKDNVFNVVTPTAWVPTEKAKRKPPFGVVKAASLLEENKVENFLQENSLLANFERNKKLIDLKEIPQEYQDIVYNQLVTTLSSLPDVSLRKFLSNFEWPSLSADEATLQEMSEIIAAVSGKDAVDEIEVVEDFDVYPCEDIEQFEIQI